MMKLFQGIIQKLVIVERTLTMKNKKLTLDIKNKEQLIMENVEYKDGKLKGEIGGVEGTLIKNKIKR